MKEGNEKEYHGGVQIGLISSKFNVEGPIVKDKTAFIISGRRTYIDVLPRPLMNKKDGTGGYFFYDFNAKVNHKFSDKSRLYLSLYTGRDKAYSQYDSEYNSDNSTYSNKDEANMWGNVTTAVRWNYTINNKLFSNTTLTYSSYSFNVKSEMNSQTNHVYYKYSSGIDDLSSKIEFDWYPNSDHEVKFGFNYIYHVFNPAFETI